MTKPDDIPQDVWDKASKHVVYTARIAVNEAQQVSVARAIIAAKAEEREKCADLAWVQAKQGATHDQIASAIRKRGEAE